MTQMTHTTETTPSKIDIAINAIQTAEARARELKASIRAEETEASPNFQAITSWRAEADVIENRQLPTLRGEYARAVSDSRAAELAGMRAQLAQLGERIGQVNVDKLNIKAPLNEAIHTAQRVGTGAAWLEVARLARLFAPIVDEATAIDSEMKQLSAKIGEMERN